MREIKFEYGFESVNGIVKKIYHLHEVTRIQELCDVWNVLPIKYVRQFTGLRDRNGKEIYEGDMVNLFGSFGVVLAGNGKPAVFEVKANGCDYVLKRPEFEFEWGRLSRIEELFWSCEVIGSIYENPELIN